MGLSFFRMSPRRRFCGWILLWAVVQFLTPAVATYADALLERDGADAPAHIESSTGGACRAVHPSACGLCQVVQRHGIPTALACPPSIATLVVAPRASINIAPTTSVRGRLSLPRAPPRV
jgi:hypothetical protein